MRTFSAKKLHEIRSKAGFTQSKLAKKIKMQKLQVSRYENGKQVPKDATIHNLAKALSCSYDDFFEPLAFSWINIIEKAKMRSLIDEDANSRITNTLLSLIDNPTDKNKIDFASSLIDTVPKNLLIITCEDINKIKISDFGYPDNSTVGLAASQILSFVSMSGDKTITLLPEDSISIYDFLSKQPIHKDTKVDDLKSKIIIAVSPSFPQKLGDEYAITRAHNRFYDRLEGKHIQEIIYLMNTRTL